MRRESSEEKSPLSTTVATCVGSRAPRLRGHLGLWAFLLTCSLIPRAHAEGLCASPSYLDGPVELGYAEGDFGVTRSACPEDRYSLRLRANALIDTPNFYGTLVGDCGLSYGYRQSERLGLFASLEVLQYRFVQNASITRTRLAIGQASVGASYLAWENETAALSPTLRLTLPTSTAYAHIFVFGLEPGLALASHPHPMLTLNAALSALVGATASTRAGSHLSAGLEATAGAAFRPVRWLSLVAELDSLFGYSSAFDRLAAQGALRAHLGGQWAAELGLGAPFAGSSRIDWVAALRLSYLP